MLLNNLNKKLKHASLLFAFISFSAGFVSAAEPAAGLQKNYEAGFLNSDSQQHTEDALVFLKDQHLMQEMAQLMAEGKPRKTVLSNGWTIGQVWQRWGDYIHFWFNTFCRLEYAAREIVKQPWTPHPASDAIIELAAAPILHAFTASPQKQLLPFYLTSEVSQNGNSPSVLSVMMGVNIKQRTPPPGGIEIEDGTNTYLIDVARLYARLDKVYSEPEKNQAQMRNLHAGLVRRLMLVVRIINEANATMSNRKIYSQECLKVLEPFGQAAQAYADQRWNQLLSDIVPQELSTSDTLDKTLNGKLCDKELLKRLQVSKPGELVWTRRIGGNKLWDFYLIPEDTVNRDAIVQATREACDQLREEDVLTNGRHTIMVRVPNNEGRYVYAVREIECQRHFIWDGRTQKWVYGHIMSLQSPHNNYAPYHYYNNQPKDYMLEVRPHNGDRTAFASFMGVHSPTGRVKGTLMEERVHAVLQQHKVHAMHQLPLAERSKLEQEYARYQTENIAANLEQDRVPGVSTPQEELKARVARRNAREWQQIRAGERVHAVPEAFRIHQSVLDKKNQGLRIHADDLRIHYMDEMPGVHKGQRVSSLLHIHEHIHNQIPLTAREKAFFADMGSDGYRASSESGSVVQGNASDAERNFSHVQDALGDYEARPQERPQNALQHRINSVSQGQGTNVTHITREQREAMLADARKAAEQQQ